MSRQGRVNLRGSVRGNLLRNGLLCVAAVLAFVGAPPASAQVSGYGDKTMGENRGDELPTVLQRVAVTQHLDAQLPLNTPFMDDTGAPVTLGKYFDGKHPVILSLVYYNCPMLCSEELDGLTSALEMVHLKPGKDFQIVVISIDPSETPKLAATRKAFYLKRYGHPETADGWHLLIGPKSSIDAVTNTIGFGYVKVPATSASWPMSLYRSRSWPSGLCST